MESPSLRDENSNIVRNTHRSSTLCGVDKSFVVPHGLTTRPRATCYMAKSENIRHHHVGHVVISHYQRNGFFESLEILISFSPRRVRVPRKRLLLRNRLGNLNVTSRLDFHPIKIAWPSLLSRVGRDIRNTN